MDIEITKPKEEVEEEIIEGEEPEEATPIKQTLQPIVEVKEFCRVVLAGNREIYLGSSSMDCTALANLVIQLHALIKGDSSNREKDYIG